MKLAIYKVCKNIIPASILLANLVLIASASAGVSASDTTSPLKATQQIHDFMAKADEGDVDLARIKLTFDKIIDPSIDVEVSISQIDLMIEVVQSMAGRDATSAGKIVAIKKYIYEPGEWNNNRPYQYDHNDPLGTKLSNKLMPNYMISRRGNCITMPFLFLILADRMGLNVTTSTAPLHVLVKWTEDETGITRNLETTSGANPARDVWYRQNMPMTDVALEQGVYLDSLSTKETIAVMATVLVEHYMELGEYDQAIRTAEAILRYYPKYAFVHVKKGTAYYRLLAENFYSKYPAQHDIPKGLLGQYSYFTDNNREAFMRAQALGWQPAQ